MWPNTKKQLLFFNFHFILLHYFSLELLQSQLGDVYVTFILCNSFNFNSSTACIHYVLKTLIVLILAMYDFTNYQVKGSKIFCNKIHDFRPDARLYPVPSDFVFNRTAWSLMAAGRNNSTIKLSLYQYERTQPCNTKYKYLDLDLLFFFLFCQTVTATLHNMMAKTITFIIDDFKLWWT